MLIDLHGTVYRHKTKGGRYKPREKVLVKIAGEWVKGTAYQCVDSELYGQTYVRADKEFCEKFVAIASVKNDSGEG